MLIRSLFLATCLVAAPAAAQQASFDCAKAKTPREKAICQGNHTAELDRAMDELYRAALDRAGDHRGDKGEPREAVVAAQKKWLATLDARCGRAKPDLACIERLYKQRIAGLARVARGTSGAFISGSYAYREKAQAGEMFLAEMPDGTTLVLVETVNVGHISPHTCSLMDRVKERHGEILRYRDAEVSKTCALEITVTGNRAVMREAPKDCFEVARHFCGAHGYMLGTYVKR